MALPAPRLPHRIAEAALRKSGQPFRSTSSVLVEHCEEPDTATRTLVPLVRIYMPLR
jgi:hypothetical protein